MTSFYLGKHHLIDVEGLVDDSDLLAGLLFIPFREVGKNLFIYADARKGGLTPELRPLSTIIFVLVLVMLIIINKRSEKNKKK